MFEEFREVIQKRHQVAREWKGRTGGKALGYFCCYLPEEFLYAAGVLPIRVLGSHEPQDVTEPHIFAMYCPFSRDVLAQGLLGRYDYLNGVAMAHTCMHMRQAYDAWRIHVPQEFDYFLFMPCRTDFPPARKVLLGEFQNFRKAIEDWTGVKITEGKLRHAVDVYNTNRRLMREIYALRKSPEPPLSGAEAMEMVLSSMFMDKAEHNKLLKDLLKKLPDRKDKPKPGPRLMLIGSENDEVEFVRIVEKAGAIIVTDDYCIGTRYFWSLVPEDGDLMEALVVRYFDKPVCPTKDLPTTREGLTVGDLRRRYKQVLDWAKEYNVQGAIQAQQKFCDPHEFDIPPLTRHLQANGIPSLFLELDTTLAVGQIKTRAEAFLEMLEMELV